MANVGAIDLTVSLRGRGLTAEAAAMGAVAGRAFREAFNRGAAGNVTSSQAAGRTVGNAFSRGLRSAVTPQTNRIVNNAVRNLRTALSSRDNFGSYIRYVGDADSATTRLTTSIDRLSKRGSIAGFEAQRLRDRVAKLRRDFDSAAGGADRLTRSINRSGNSMRRFRRGGGGFDRETLLIIIAVVLGFQQLSVLASAAAAGVVILAGAIGSLALGGAVLAVGISGLAKRIKTYQEYTDLARKSSKDLTDAEKERLAVLRKQVSAYDPVIRSLTKLGGAFSKLRDQITDRVFAGLASGFDDLRTTVIPGLRGSILDLADSVNTSLGNALERIGRSSSIATMSTLIEGAGPVVESLTTAALNLVQALGNIGLVALPFVQNFASSLSDLIDRFNQWTGTLAGRNALQRFFEDGVRVLGAFGDLLGGVVKTIGNLANPAAVDRTVAFLDNLTASLPFLEDLLEILGRLDIFGLIAELMNEVGNALSPLLDLLKPIADIIRSGLVTGFQALGFVLDIMLLPLRLLQPLFDGLAYAFQLWNERNSELLTGLQPLLDVFDQLFTDVNDALTPALEGLIDALFSLLPSPEELARIIRTEVLPNIQKFASWVRDDLVPAIEKGIEQATAFIDSIGGFPGLMQKVDAFVKAFQAAMKVVQTVLSPVIFAVNLLIDALITLGAIRVKPKVDTTAIPYTSTSRGGRFASGTFANTPTFGTFGEAGPEMVVPLRRPLDQVDPAVRAVSAFAQGLSLPGSSTDNRTTVEQNITVVTPSRNPEVVAKVVSDRLAEDVAA